MGALTQNPYTSLPAYCFWRKAVAGLPSFQLDLLTESPFRISATDKVATAGSCFAQHIARKLKAAGFNYYVGEQAPPSLTSQVAAHRSYEVFSARYGSIYTSRQLLQLFDRAYGTFSPSLHYWSQGDGRYVDPFRPLIEPDGFDNPEAVEVDRATHLSHVRHLLETLDVFVFTLGLTEGWRHRKDGAALPIAPGVAGGEWDESQYEFVNQNVLEVTADVTAFIDKLRNVNSSARVILTVSPIPLIATYENRHVLVSTTYSKSVLRVAAEEISTARQDVVYFPAYEIVISNTHRYFENDLRSVNELGVEHVMRTFFRHFIDSDSPISLPEYEPEVRQQIRETAKVVCDEESIDPAPYVPV